MRHFYFTCKNHPTLRWECKDIAASQKEDGSWYYNGARNIRFCGVYSGKFHSDNSGLECSPYTEDFKLVAECSCATSDLIRAPEDAELERLYRK